MRRTRERGENGAVRGEIIFLGHNFGQLANSPRCILLRIVFVMLARIRNVTLAHINRDITICRWERSASRMNYAENCANDRPTRLTIQILLSHALQIFIDTVHNSFKIYLYLIILIICILILTIIKMLHHKQFHIIVSKKFSNKKLIIYIIIPPFLCLSYHLRLKLVPEQWFRVITRWRKLRIFVLLDMNNFVSYVSRNVRK